LIPLGELFQTMSLVPLQKISTSSLLRFIISFFTTFVKAAIPAPGLTLLHSDLAVYPVICWHNLLHGHRLLKQSCVYFVDVFCPFIGWVRCCSLLIFKLFVVLGGFFILLGVFLLLLTCMVVMVGIIR